MPKGDAEEDCFVVDLKVPDLHVTKILEFNWMKVLTGVTLTSGHSARTVL